MSRHYAFKYDKELILMVGNIGSGKSTHVKQKEKEYVVISRDKIRYMLGNGNYVFVKKIDHAVWAAELTLYEQLLGSGMNIIIDEVNVSKEERQRYITGAKEAGYKVIVAVFPRISRDEAVRRRFDSNHGEFTKEEWAGVWDRYNSQYEEPSYEEDLDWIIKIDNEDMNNVFGEQYTFCQKGGCGWGGTSTVDWQIHGGPAWVDETGEGKVYRPGHPTEVLASVPLTITKA